MIPTLTDEEDGIMLSSSDSSSESLSSSASCHSTLGPRWKRRRVPNCETKIDVKKIWVQCSGSDKRGQYIVTNGYNASSLLFKINEWCAAKSAFKCFLLLDEKIVFWVCQNMIRQTTTRDRLTLSTFEEAVPGGGGPGVRPGHIFIIRKGRGHGENPRLRLTAGLVSNGWDEPIKSVGFLKELPG